MVGFLLVYVKAKFVKLLMPPHPLTNFEIEKYYQNEPKFNGIYSRSNLSKIIDGTYITNLDDHELIGTYWTALYGNAENGTYLWQFWSWTYSKRNWKIYWKQKY